MNQRLCSLLIVASALFSLALTGCGINYEASQQHSGQECRFDEDCVDDLVCTQRRCRPLSNLDADIPDVDESDAGLPDTDLTDADEADTSDPDTDVIPGTCEVGERTCADEQTALRCDGGPNGATAWVPVHCADTEFCADDRGECLPREQAPCCEDGCGENQICSECQCIDTDPTECTVQDQPCEVEGQVANGFICTEFQDTGELTCLGICNGDRDNPSSSCPTSNTYCYIEEGQPNGICLSNCEQGDRCASEDFGCVAYEHDGGFGLCLPNSGDATEGEACDEDQPFSCADGALCADGTCRASCRPFGSYGDCTGGDVCLPAGTQTGVCVDAGSNANTTANDECSFTSEVCGEDSLVCVPAFNNPSNGRCVQVCRLDADDCPQGAPCMPAVTPDNRLGICLSLGGL